MRGIEGKGGTCKTALHSTNPPLLGGILLIMDNDSSPSSSNRLPVLTAPMVAPVPLLQ